MIVTLTPNPAVDLTLWVDRLIPGTVQRASASQIDPAGKGVNVSRMVKRLGGATITLGLLAGETGRIVEERLDREHVPHQFLRVPGLTRVDVTVWDRSAGRSTSVFDRGPECSLQQLRQMEEALETWLPAARVVVIAGSLPPGAPLSTYRRWVERANRVEAVTIVDAGGEAMREAMAAHPSVIKPNRAEAEELLGRPIVGPDEEAIAAIELARRTGGVVVLSLGARGAVVARQGEAWRAIPPRVIFRSTIGSGDSMVAGIALALARGGDILEGARLGTAAGAATAEAPGTALGEAVEVERLLPAVEIEPVEFPTGAAVA